MKFSAVTRRLSVLALSCVATSPAVAHHSVAGQFDVGKMLRLTGTVARVDWVNPHTYLYLDVKEKDGQVTTWKLESLPVAMMRKAGVSKQLLIGQKDETVSIDVNPARDGTRNLGFMLRITYGDGRHYQFAAAPN